MNVRIDLYAHFDVSGGLTISALNTERLLRERGMSVNRHSIETRERSTGPCGASEVNLFHINPGDVAGFMMWPHEDPRFERRLNACAPFWELDRLPNRWPPVLAAMDVVLAPTAFIADAVLRAVPDAKVVELPQAVALPDGVQADRSRFGLPGDGFVFGTSFAAEAVVDRKNPFATIEAFRRAFPAEPDVALVVRAAPMAEDDPHDLWTGLEDAADGDARIHVLRGRLDYAGVLSLYASFDAYVSLHRAEGLGLGMMESMSLGRPVVATAWSGNMDFMTAGNSLAVDYRLRPIAAERSSPYSLESIGFVGEWAEPDVDDAAAKMRLLYVDRDLTRRLGDQARADMDARRIRVAGASFVDSIAAMLTEGVVDTAEHADKAAALRAVERRRRRRGVYMRPYLYARREASRLLRRTGLR